MGPKQIEIIFQNRVQAVTFADESQVVGGYYSGHIRGWKIEDGQQLGITMQANNRINFVAVSRDGHWIVSGDHGKTATVWDAATRDKVLEYSEHEGPVLAVDISSDCTKVASVDGVAARIFSITSGIRLLPPVPHDHAFGVKFSPDGSLFATASHYHGFRVHNTRDGDILFDSGLENSTGPWPVTPLAWLPDGRQLFVASVGKITCFNVSDSSSSEWFIHDIRSGASVASNGKFIACSAGSSVSLWDCASHKQIGSIITHTALMECFSLSSSGGYLACGLKDGRILIHNLRDVLPHEYFCPRLPLIQLSDEALELWIRDDLMNTDMLLSKEITSASSPSHHVLANRALLRARSKRLEFATADAKESLQVRPSPTGYIAMAVALLGQGDREGALSTFDLAFHDCEPHDIRFLLLMKLILAFESGNQDEAIMHVEHIAARANNNDHDEATYLYTQVLGVMYMKKGNYGRAVPLFQRAKDLAAKDKQCPPLMTISLIFGWNFNGLDIAAQQRICEALYAEERTEEAVEILLSIIRTSGEEVQRGKATVDWIADFTTRCDAALEGVDDEDFGPAAHDDKIMQHSSALSLGRPGPAGLLVKRSRDRAAKGFWEDALQYANDAVKVDPSYPWGYQAKHAVLHRAKRYDEATDAFKSMLHVIEQSNDPAIRKLRKNYISPSETTAVIDHIIRGVLESSPLILINTTTGCLCDGPERIRTFKADPMFKELVSSMTTEWDNEQILRVVIGFFGYVMFSHAWQGHEPLFQDVSAVKSVWNLPITPLNEKLQNFCKETRRLGHNWAWSDTCCIDKTTSAILNQSLTSMYKWYADSAATLVFLAGIAHPSQPGDLTRSFWMTRAWTLHWQELLAPKVMFFYDSDWKPYLGNIGVNHKESPEIMQELADAIKIPRGTIVTFSPDDLGVCEKLRLASTRNATVKEDVAYSLIGIFKSDIRPHYGEGADALGHLLEEVVARFGEVTVLAWSGKSSSYNSCLPASISVYNQTPYYPPSLEGEEMETCIAELRSKLPHLDALGIYSQINVLPPARFATRRLHLPCVVFPVRRLGIQETRRGNEKLYRARVSGLGRVEFTTADDLSLHRPQKFVFAHPWIRHIRGPSDEVVLGGDPGVDIDLDSDSGFDAGSDDVVIHSPLHDVSAPRVDEYTRALQMIARLGQPFSALLLVQQPNGEYKRVATENEIVVSGLGTDIMRSKTIQAKVLEIL